MALRNLTTFSLTELLVVMAILVVLAAVLFPVLVKARSNSDQATCESNLKKLGLAFVQYIQDDNQRIPVDEETAGSGVAGLIRFIPMSRRRLFSPARTTNLPRPGASAPISYLYNRNGLPGGKGIRMSSLNAPADPICLDEGSNVTGDPSSFSELQSDAGIGAVHWQSFPTFEMRAIMPLRGRIRAYLPAAPTRLGLGCRA